MAADDAIRALTALESARQSAHLDKNDERYIGRIQDIGDQFVNRTIDSGMSAADAQKKWQRIAQEVTANTRGGWDR